MENQTIENQTLGNQIKYFVPWYVWALISLLIILAIITALNSLLEYKEIPHVESIVNDSSNLHYCTSEEVIIAETITFMEKNNITILGSTKCYYCALQLEEFGVYKNEAVDKDIFIFCDQGHNKKCEGILSVPSWKKNNELIHVGKVSIEDIIIKFT